MRNLNHVLEWKRADRYPELSENAWWSNDKTDIELGYRKISWFVRVSQSDVFATDKSRYFTQLRPIIVIKLFLHVDAFQLGIPRTLKQNFREDSITNRCLGKEEKNVDRTLENDLNQAYS